MLLLGGYNPKCFSIWKMGDPAGVKPPNHINQRPFGFLKLKTTVPTNPLPCSF